MSSDAKFVMLVVVVLLCVVLLGAGLFGCNNPSTPAGYMGYVTRRAVFGKTTFVEMQTGPTSTGLGWLLHVTNISITPYTYDEPMHVLSKDNLSVGFVIHIIWRVKPTFEGVKEFTEHYSILEQGTNPDVIAQTAYNNFIKQPMCNAARNETQARNAFELKNDMQEISHDIDSTMHVWVGNAPFDIMNVVIGDISYDPTVTDAISKKLATTQLLQQKDAEIDIARKDATKRLIEAEGIAKSMDVVQSKLTPLYVQHEAIDAQKLMVNAPNHTTIYIPIGANGVPVVSTHNPVDLK